MPDVDRGLSRVDFLLEEYRHYREFVARNEAAGETRVNLFLTLNAALIALLALGDGMLIASPGGPGGVALILLLVALLLVGRTVLARTVRRNIETTRVIHHIDRIRGQLRGGDPTIEDYLRWPSTAVPEYQARQISLVGFLGLKESGLAEMVALLNAFLFGALAAVVVLQVGSKQCPEVKPDGVPVQTCLALWAGGAAVVASLLAWVGQVYEIRWKYNNADGAVSPKPKKNPQQGK